MDLVDCQVLPWHMNYICGGLTIVEAGKTGCATCPDLRKICATTCNWCTPHKENSETPSKIRNIDIERCCIKIAMERIK